MIRRTQMNISYANHGKQKTLDSIFEESRRVVNLYIEALWLQKNFASKFVDFKVETWLSARLQQCLGKQALEIVKSQRKKKKKTMPVFKSDVINLDSRFVDIQFNNNSFDVWFRLNSIGNKISLNLPSKKHRHYFKYQNWTMKKSVRLSKFGDNYYIDLYFEKDSPEPKTDGKSIGLDCGYKKLLVSSENQVYDTGLEKVYKKISRKKQGSIRFKKALVERDNKINQSVNQIDIKNIKTVVVEDLKNVKHKSKGKLRKKFNNKLQRWSYSKVLNKLSRYCEENAVSYFKINPAYTSQTCNQCGFKHRDNRSGEKFRCLNCGFSTDADYNASLNILHRGVYSPSTTIKNENH